MPNFIKKYDSELYILCSSLIYRINERNVFIYKSGLTSFFDLSAILKLLTAFLLFRFLDGQLPGPVRSTKNGPRPTKHF